MRLIVAALLLLAACAAPQKPAAPVKPWGLDDVTRVYGMCRNVGHSADYCQCFTNSLMLAFPNLADQSVNEDQMRAAVASCEEPAAADPTAGPLSNPEAF